MRQLALFASRAQPAIVVADRGDVRYVPEFLDPALGRALVAELRTSTAWRADSRVMYGRRVLVPRETAARGAKMPQDWTPLLRRVRALVEEQTGTAYDYVFINRYRNGNDSVAWHNDDDAEEDPRRVIASLSLGATRTFELRPKRSSGLNHRKIAIELAHGDLIVMQGDTQLFWEHCVPKESRIAGERINLTFRQHLARKAAATAVPARVAQNAR